MPGNHQKKKKKKTSSDPQSSSTSSTLGVRSRLDVIPGDVDGVKLAAGVTLTVDEVDSAAFSAVVVVVAAEERPGLPSPDFFFFPFFFS